MLKKLRIRIGPVLSQEAAMKKTLKGTFYLALFALALLVASPASAIVCGCWCQGLVPSRPCSDPLDPWVHNCGEWLSIYGSQCVQSTAFVPGTTSPPSFLAPDVQEPELCIASPAR